MMELEPGVGAFYVLLPVASLSFLSVIHFLGCTCFLLRNLEAPNTQNGYQDLPVEGALTPFPLFFSIFRSFFFPFS